MRFICALFVVEDISRARHFYETVLGQKVKHDYGENVVFHGDFAIHQKSHFEDLLGQSCQLNGNSAELYFEDMAPEKLLPRLVNEGVAIIHDLLEQPWKQRVIRFRDPDGHIVEVGEPMDHVAFRLHEQDTPISEISHITSLSDEEVLAAIERYSL